MRSVMLELGDFGRHHRGRWAFGGCLLAAALMFRAAPVGAQTDEQRAGARAVATQGAAAFNEGRFQDAIDLFNRAESLVHAPPHLLFVARAHEKLGQLVKARETYNKIVREQLDPAAPQAFRDAQSAAAEELRRIEPRLAHLVITVQGAEAGTATQVTMDGIAVPGALVGVSRPVDPGEHRVEATAAGYRAEAQTVTLKEGERAAVTLNLIADPSAAVPVQPGAAPVAPVASVSSSPSAAVDVGSDTSGLRVASWVALGVGAVGVAGGTVFLLQSASKRSDADELHDTCVAQAGGCRENDPGAAEVAELDDDARTAGTLATIGYIVGGVGLAAGVTLFVLSSGDSRETVQLSPYVGLTGAGLRGRF